MATDDHLSRLERLTRLREAGALSAEEFDREKAQLLQWHEATVTTASSPEDPENKAMPAQDGEGRAPGKRRWPFAALAGLTLLGGSGWALAHRGGATSSVAMADAAPGVARKASATQSPPTAKPAPSAIRSLPEEKQMDLAFDAVFELGEREMRVTEDAVYTYAKGKLVWASFGPVLIVEGNGEPYPAGLGTLGIFYLREMHGAKFAETGRWPDAVTGSIMGNPPQWKIRRDILDGLVIESTAGGVWQGYVCDAKTLTELTPTGPRSLVTFDSHYDSSGATEDGGQTYDGTIVNVVRNRSFDVRFDGSRLITQHFVRKGTHYVSLPAADGEESKSAIPTC